LAVDGNDSEWSPVAGDFKPHSATEVLIIQCMVAHNWPHFSLLDIVLYDKEVTY